MLFGGAGRKESNMKYDFSTIIDRSCMDSLKWNNMRALNPEVKEGIVPLTTADMEFFSPPELTEGLAEYIKGTILGYSQPTDDYRDSVIRWMKDRHHWDVKAEWITETQGVVNALFISVNAFTEPGDGVIVMTPIYTNFFPAVQRNGRIFADCPLKTDENGKYGIDFELLERLARVERNKLLLFCNPHNPVGRVWTREELEKVGDICGKNHVLIVSDEVHSDIIMPGHKHLVFGNLSEHIAENTIVCTSPSKSFNIAGLKISNIIISNDELRKKFRSNIEESFLSIRVNTLGYRACVYAYNECGEWLRQLNRKIYENSVLTDDFLSKELPDIRISDHEGTFMLWLDFRKLGLDEEKLSEILDFEAQVFLEKGTEFGKQGAGFRRMNIAAPTLVIQDALERMAAALKRSSQEGKQR